MSHNGGPKAMTTSTFSVGVVATTLLRGLGDSGRPRLLRGGGRDPSPPSSIDAGGTFQTAYGAQVTVPASVINHFRGRGPPR